MCPPLSIQVCKILPPTWMTTVAKATIVPQLTLGVLHGGLRRLSGVQDTVRPFLVLPHSCGERPGSVVSRDRPN